MIGLNKKRLITILSFLLVITGGNIIWRAIPNETRTKDISKYTLEAEEGELPSLITASGELQAQKSLFVNPHRQGIIEEMFVQEGDEVKRNQILAKIEDRDYKFRVEELTTEFENTRNAFMRREKLFLEGGISQEKYDEFRKGFLISKSKLEQLKVEGQELLIRAPLGGLITLRNAEPGTYVSPTSSRSNNENSSKRAVVEISQGLEVTSKVPESDIGRIEIGQLGSVRVDAFPDERFNSIVSKIAPRATRKNNVTSFEVRLNLVDPPKKLRIGMTADVEFQVGTSGKKTIVPTVAIVTENGKPGLLTVGKNNEPLFKKVELGSSNGNKTAIIDGIEPGEKIFIDLPPWSKWKNK